MKHVVLICAIFLGYVVSPLRAGSVINFTGSEVTGKLTLTPSSIRVETGSSPTEVNLSDVLEADFRETPFQLNYFFSSDSGGNQLPATWKGQDIGEVGTPGSVVNADGTFTLNGSGASPVKPPVPKVSDKFFFAGQPWAGDGQWTARLTEIDAKTPATAGGLMVRDTLDPDSAAIYLGDSTLGNGGFSFRTEVGKALQGTPIPNMDLPIWLRLTRFGPSVSASISSDGKEWSHVGQANFKTQASPWIGLFADSHRDKGLGKVVFDQVSFTPLPSTAQVYPPGVLLQSGSFLAGTFEFLSAAGADGDASGRFRRNGRQLDISRSKIATITMLPTERKQIAEMSSHVGLLMKNGDVLDGDFDSINGGSVLISSVLLGSTTYNRSQVRACVLHSLQAQPATYEVRLRDGSIVNTTDLGDLNAEEIVLKEATGMSVAVGLDEIAQIRAGPALVQSLAELNWKATPPPVAPVAPAPPAANATPTTNSAPVAPAPPATNATPVANAAPVAIAVPDPLPPVQCWEGKNQEEIMEAVAGTTIEFPLTGKFSALGVRIALSPGSPPNSNAVIRILADGREIARTPPFKAGDQPRFMEVTLQHPKTVTLEADSIFGGIKVLFIDPVAIRDK